MRVCIGGDARGVRGDTGAVSRVAPRYDTARATVSRLTPTRPGSVLSSGRKPGIHSGKSVCDLTQTGADNICIRYRKNLMEASSSRVSTRRSVREHPRAAIDQTRLDRLGQLSVGRGWTPFPLSVYLLVLFALVTLYP